MSDHVKDLLRALGAEFAQRRRSAGLTREQVAEAADISASTVGRAERGDVATAATSMWRMAEALEVDLSFLVHRAEDVVNRTRVDYVFGPAIELDDSEE